MGFHFRDQVMFFWVVEELGILPLPGPDMKDLEVGFLYEFPESSYPWMAELIQQDKGEIPSRNMKKHDKIDHFNFLLGDAIEHLRNAFV